MTSKYHSKEYTEYAKLIFTGVYTRIIMPTREYLYKIFLIF